MKLNWDGWLYGLGAALIGGGASAVAAGMAEGVVDPGHADIHHLLALMGTTFVIAGAISAFAYLSKSPLPSQEPTTVEVKTTTQPSESTQTTTTKVTTGAQPQEPKP